MNRPSAGAAVLTLSAFLGCHSTSATPAAAANSVPAPASSVGASSDEVAVTLPPPLATATERVRAMIAHVDDAAIDGAFSTSFLEAVPRDRVKKLFGDVAPKVGACTKVEAMKIVSPTRGSARIVCDSGVLHLQLQTQDSAPYLMDALVIRRKP